MLPPAGSAAAASSSATRRLGSNWASSLLSAACLGGLGGVLVLYLATDDLLCGGT